jgi:tRNA G18 (ribose-2'-O)-methylase SpoU
MIPCLYISKNQIELNLYFYHMNSKKTAEEIAQSNQGHRSDRSQNRLVVVLENIRSGLNVGNIFRSSDAFGIEQIFCTGYTVTPPHREVLKSALGSTESVKWAHDPDPIGVVKNLQAQGFLCIAVEQTTQSILFNEWNPTHDKIAVVFGNEVDGVTPEMIATCDASIELPQVGIKHSLNVSVCAGIVLYQIQMTQ